MGRSGRRMIKCKGVLGWVFGHNYKAVYDTTQKFPDVVAGVRIQTNQGLATIMERTSIYVGSLCKRCGNTINV